MRTSKTSVIFLCVALAVVTSAAPAKQQHGSLDFRGFITVDGQSDIEGDGCGTCLKKGEN
ncbi:hypothetical protein AAF712_010783 [Marasmius tenuissimus]|uniref:Uncharacterized protein n=1 Tax=Marasmius tenuissimus TaxID=585030 RepID=A0ABR2ZM75_9AGAR